MIHERSRKPLASGRLSKTPFPHLLLYLYEHRYSGTLTVQGPEQPEATRVLFSSGYAEAAVSSQATDTLAMVLMPMCGLVDGEYAFYADDDLVGQAPEAVRGHVDPYPFLARALRVHASDAAVEGLLGRYDGALLALQPGVDLGRFGLREDERAVAGALAVEPATYDDLSRLSDVRPQRLRRLLYLLLITKVIVPRRAAGSNPAPRFSNFPPPVAAGRDSVVPPPPPMPQGTDSSGVWGSPEPVAEAGDWQRLVRSSAPPAGSRPPSATMSTPPTVPPPAPVPSMQASPTVGAMPPPVPGPPPRPSAPPPVPAVTHTGIPPAPHRGHATSHPPAAPQVPGVVLPSAPVPTPSAMPPAEGVDSLLPRVERLCERERYGEALGALDHLLVSHAGEARVHAMRAWVIFHQAAGEAVAPDALADALADALRLDGLQPRALYVAGLQRKREGRMVEAQRYFARACGIDTDALGADDAIRLAAERELRLLDMRRRGR